MLFWGTIGLGFLIISCFTLFIWLLKQKWFQEFLFVVIILAYIIAISFTVGYFIWLTKVVWFDTI